MYSHRHNIKDILIKTGTQTNWLREQLLAVRGLRYISTHQVVYGNKKINALDGDTISNKAEIWNKGTAQTDKVKRVMNEHVVNMEARVQKPYRHMDYDTLMAATDKYNGKSFLYRVDSNMIEPHIDDTVVDCPYLVFGRKRLPLLDPPAELLDSMQTHPISTLEFIATEQQGHIQWKVNVYFSRIRYGVQRTRKTRAHKYNKSANLLEISP
jgi:hypothetical protein